jgi:LmbE family N-acetylglucosaminyl deacetylase
MKTNVYILAHPDDEVMCLHSIMHMRTETKTYVLYLTDGKPDNSHFKISKRKSEAIHVSSRLGYFGNTIFFGETFGIQDGRLATSFRREDFGNLLKIVKDLSPDYVVSTILEGGHQDHDAAYLITKKIAAVLNLQFLAYPCYCQTTSLPFYSVMKSSGNALTKPATSIERLQMCYTAFLIMLRYRTQLKTWFGLGTQILLKYLFGNLVLNFNSDHQVSDVKNFLFETRGTFDSSNLKSFERELYSWNTKVLD